MSLVVAETRGRVRVLTLNRPEIRNAWSMELMESLKEAVTAANADPAIAAIVFTGAGAAYCSGVDLPAFQSDIEKKLPRFGVASRGDDHWLAFLARMPKPTVAAVNGPAIGVGATHLLPMDIRVASPAARFAFPFVRLAMYPELGSTYFLPQLVGLGRATDWLMTARVVDADEALASGLVSQLVPADKLIERAVEVGEQLAATPLKVLSKLRMLLRANATDNNLAAVVGSENAANFEARYTPEHEQAFAKVFRSNRSAK
jgi:enoyl-CoA hydratase/carnithine racemase